MVGYLGSRGRDSEMKMGMLLKGKWSSYLISEFCYGRMMEIKGKGQLGI